LFYSYKVKFIVAFVNGLDVTCYGIYFYLIERRSARRIFFFSSINRYSSLGALFLLSIAETFINLCLNIDLFICLFKSSTNAWNFSYWSLLQ